MLKIRSILLSLVIFTIYSLSEAKPLGTIPTIETESVRLVFDFRSDLWTSPYTYKSSPIRIFGGDFYFPLYSSETWKISAQIADESLGLGRTDIQLGKTNVFIGSALRDQSAGLAFNKTFENGSSLSVFGAFDSASDEPHQYDRDEWVEATVLYFSKLIENHRWIIAVNQSNNRGLYNGKPFPYFGAIYQAAPDFTVAFGFPFLHLTWGTLDTSKREIRLTPFGANFSFSKKIEDDFIFDAFAAFTVRSYLHSARVDDDDRLYYQEIAMEASVKKRLTPTTGVLFGLGYSFDRRLYESETIYSPNTQMTEIDSDFYGRVAVEFRL